MIQCFDFVLFVSGDFETDPRLTTINAIAIYNINGLRSQIALSNLFLYNQHYVFHRKAIDAKEVSEILALEVKLCLIPLGHPSTMTWWQH